MATTSQAVYTGRCSRGGVINLLCETDVPYSPTRERLRSSSASSAVSSPVTPTTPQPQHWDTTPRYFSFAGSGEELRPHPCLTPPQSRGWGFNYPPPTYPARGLWPLPTPEPSPPRMAPDVCFQTCTPIPGFVRTVNEPDTAPPPVNSPQPSSTTSSPPPSPTPVARKRHSAPDTPIEDQQTTRTPVKRKKKVAAAPMVKKARKPRPKRRHYCDECEKSFTTSGHLARHKRIHSGVKPFPCPLPECDSRFSRQDNMMQHYRTHVLKISYTNTGQNFFIDSGSLPILSANSQAGDNDDSGIESCPATPPSSSESDAESEMEE